MKARQLAGLVGLGLLLQGCAAAGLAVAGAGAGVSMGTGVEHTMNGIAYKTFTAPANNVRFATLKTLDRMGMTITTDEQTEAGWKLVAAANERTIDIELERVTDQVTRMRVVANKGDIFFKDASTATEVILQTAQTLQDSPAPTARTTAQRTRKEPS